MAASNADAPSPMKLDPATRGLKKDALGVDPNAVPRAISDDSKRPARVGYRFDEDGNKVRVARPSGKDI